MLKFWIFAVLALMPAVALAEGYPSVECTLSADRSSVVVIASNPGDTAYKCAAFCRVNTTGQRAISKVDCSFNLGKNAAEKAVCTKKGGGAGFYSAISPTKSTCVPR